MENCTYQRKKQFMDKSFIQNHEVNSYKKQKTWFCRIKKISGKNRYEGFVLWEYLITGFLLTFILISIIKVHNNIWKNTQKNQIEWKKKYEINSAN